MRLSRQVDRHAPYAFGHAFDEASAARQFEPAHLYRDCLFRIAAPERHVLRGTVMVGAVQATLGETCDAFVHRALFDRAARFHHGVNRELLEFRSGRQCHVVGAAICVDTLGRNRMVDSLLPEDIQKLRADLIATRAVSTVNHYLATFSGFLYWCENNKYCSDLGKHCVRFTKSSKDPDPLTYEEYLSLIEKGCLHPIDKAAVTVAVYTGLRPGELLALAVEDVAPDFSKITVRRSITQSVTFKVPKTKKERTVLLQPPAREAMKVLVADAEQREAADLTVWLNRHESRIDHVRVLLSPKTQARKKIVNDYFVPSAWNTKWINLVRRAEIRPRPPYQTRHTFACWNLTARGNLAFIANQLGHKDYSMLVTVYGRWIDTESSRELERIWEGMQNMAQTTPKLRQEQPA